MIREKIRVDGVRRFIYRIAASMGWLAVFVFAGAAVAGVGDVEDLSGRKYFERAHQVLSEAKDSISVVMYSITVRPNAPGPAMKLCEDLVEAKERGVKVTVILEDENEKNRDAYGYLRNSGINACLDTGDVFTHNKVVIADGETVILGSTNWTDAALTSNNESNALVRSREFAREILEGISAIKIDKSGREFDKNRLNFVSVPRKPFYDEQVCGRMVNDHDERAFDLYFLLLYLCGGKEGGEVAMDCAKAARYLGIEGMGPEGYRRQIMRSLDKLAKKYGLIKYEKIYGEEPKVWLLDYPPKKEFFKVPFAYWEYGWTRKLSMRAKYCLFINYYEVPLSPTAPWWHASVPTLSKKFNAGKWAISKGMQELKRAGLLEIRHPKIEKGYEDRQANSYRLRELLSEDEIAMRREILAQRYGEKEVERAQRLAAMLDEPGNFDAIEEFALLAREYGEEKVLQATRITARKAKDNPKRTLEYVIGILKKGLR